MTSEQYKRWHDFAMRMARTCYAPNRRPTGAWIAERVDTFITSLDEPLAIIDWDNSKNGAGLAGDLMSLYEDEYQPYWNFEDRVDWNKPDAQNQLWTLEEKATEQWCDQFFGPVRCCVRAGLDVASAPSAGVVGFTVRDIRRMYPAGIPDWLASGWTDDIRSAPDTTGIWL